MHPAQVGAREDTPEPQVVNAAEAAAPSSANWRVWLLRGSLAVLVPIALLVMVELALRLFNVG